MVTRQRFFIFFRFTLSAFLSSKPISVNVTQVDALHNLQAVATRVHTHT